MFTVNGRQNAQKQAQNKVILSKHGANTVLCQTKEFFLHYTHYQSPQWCPTNILYALIRLQWKFYLKIARKIVLNHLHFSLSAWADETATNRTTAATNKFFILKKNPLEISIKEI